MTAWLIAAAVATPLLGRVGDLVGKRRVFVLALLFIYLLLAAQWLRPRTEVWQRENGNMNGDRSILRAFSTSMTVAGGMCALYALEDYTGQSIVPNI